MKKLTQIIMKAKALRKRLIPKRRNLLKWAGLGCLGLSAVYAIFQFLGNQKIAQAMNDLKKSDRPTSLTELKKENLPDWQDAALFYQSAQNILRSEAAGEVTIFEKLVQLSTDLANEGDNEEVVSLARLRDNPIVEEALRLLDIGSRRDGCRFRSDNIKKPVLMLLDAFEDQLLVYRLSDIVISLALTDIRMGNFDRAKSEMFLALRMTRAHDEQFLLHSHMIRLHQYSRCIDLVKEIVASKKLTAAEIQEVISSLGELKKVNKFQRALDGDRLIISQIYNGFTTEEYTEMFGTSKWKELMVVKIHTFMPSFSYDYAFYLKEMGRQANACNSVESLIEFAKGVGYTSEPLPVYGLAISRQAVSSGSTISHFARGVVEAQLVSAGLMVLKMQLESGNIPDTLPDEPWAIDLFSNNQLKYTKLGGGFLISSVGQDGVDNSGEEDDLVWLYSYQGE